MVKSLAFRCCHILGFLFGAAMIFSCTSTSTRGLPQPDLPSASGSGGAARVEQKRYESPEGVLSSRMSELSPKLSSAEVFTMPPAVSPVQVPSQSVAHPSHEALLPELLTLQSGAWKETLEKTESRWSDCLRLSFVKAGEEECRAVGRARAVSLVRLGLRDDAWRLWEFFMSAVPSSKDALVFASLYMESGTPQLCARLSSLGEHWEPAALVPRLRALQIKCLRLSGEMSEARSVVTQSLIEFPQEIALQTESALLSLSEKNLTQGCDILERLFLNKERELAVLYNWGQCLILRRDSEALKGVLERGRVNWPSELVWTLLEGELALLEGRFEAARQSGLDYLATATGDDEFRAQAYRLSRVLSEER